MNYAESPQAVGSDARQGQASLVKTDLMASRLGMYIFYVYFCLKNPLYLKSFWSDDTQW